MFGRNKQDREKASDGWKWRDRRERRKRSDEERGEAFSEFLNAVLNIARGQAFYFADRYRNRAAQVVDDFAVSLRDTGARYHPDEGRSPFMDDIADDLEDLSDVIRDIRLSSALAEIEHLARRKPLVFGLGAVAAGYLITRAARRNGQAAPSRRGRRGGRY